MQNTAKPETIADGELRLIRTEELNRIANALESASRALFASANPADRQTLELIDGAQADLGAAMLNDNRRLPPELENSLEIRTRMF